VIRTALLATLLSAGVASAGIFADYRPERHDRFLGPVAATGNVANPGFLLSDHDVTGIGVGTNGGVLISDRHVLAAAHFSGSTWRFVNDAGEQITFGTASQRDATTTFRSAAGNLVTQASDVRIITLDRPVTPADGLTPLPIFVGDVADYAGLQLVAYDQDDRAGLNYIDGGRNPGNGQPVDPVILATFPGGSRPTAVIAYDFDTATNGGSGRTGFDEIGLIDFDSGHAALACLDDGSLVVIGTHFAVAAVDGPDRDENYLNFSSAAGFYQDQVTGFVTDDGGLGLSFATIPEPASAATLGVAAALLLRRRCR
jgi:hypothetical protein